MEINVARINHSNLYYLMKVFQIRQNLKSGPILAGAGFVKKAGFRPQPEPNSGTGLLSIPHVLFRGATHVSKSNHLLLLRA